MIFMLNRGVESSILIVFPVQDLTESIRFLLLKLPKSYVFNLETIVDLIYKMKKLLLSVHEIQMHQNI